MRPRLDAQFGAGHLHVRLADQRGRLEGVAGAFAVEQVAGQAAQFGADVRQQPVDDLRIASVQPLEKGGDGFLPFHHAR